MARVRISQYLVEALVPTGTFDPLTITGCGVSQYLVEVLVESPSQIRVSQYVIEALVTEDDTQTTPGGGPGAGGTRTYGYAV